MTSSDFLAISPLLTLSAGTVLLMLQIAFLRNLSLTAGLAAFTLVAAAWASIPASSVSPMAVTPLLYADQVALVFSALFCLAGAVTVLISRDYLKHRGDEPEEYFLLLILSTLGACILAYASHLASLLLGLELLSIALYALIGYPDKAVLPLEAATKYLVLSGAASATALFGFALLYASTGALGFSEMGARLEDAEVGQAILLVGAAMAVAGIGFKLSVVPFHLWTPDVYSGAPAPITGFLASVAKAAVFIVLIRWFVEADLFRFRILIEVIALMAVLSMLMGNLLALLQTNIKRLLAYSSIAHVGYLLIVFMAAINPAVRSFALESAAFYLIAYTVTTLAAFTLLTVIASNAEQNDNLELRDIQGLFWANPLLAGLLMLAMLSLAGIPLTAGFFAKFYLFSAAVSGSHWVLMTSLIVGSGIGIYYYLRVVYQMTMRPNEAGISLNTEGRWQTTAVAIVLIAGILLLGIAPQPLMEYLRSIL